MNNSVNSDLIVSVTSKESLTISRPSKGDWLWKGDTMFSRHLELINDALALKIPNLDSRGGSSTKPVSVRREDEGIDQVTSFQRIKVLVFVQIPKHGDSIFATRGTEGSIRGDGDGGDVSSMAKVVGL
jgi:hypothetical protein